MISIISHVAVQLVKLTVAVSVESPRLRLQRLYRILSVLLVFGFRWPPVDSFLDKAHSRTDNFVPLSDEWYLHPNAWYTVCFGSVIRAVSLSHS
jgi:hypothetical protein